MASGALLARLIGTKSDRGYRMANKSTLLSSANITLVIGFILAVAILGYLVSISGIAMDLYPDLGSHSVGSAINAAIGLVIVISLKLYVTRQLLKSRTVKFKKIY